VAVAITWQWQKKWQWQWLDGSEWVRSKGFLKRFRMVLKSAKMDGFWLSYGYFMAKCCSGKKNWQKSGSGSGWVPVNWNVFLKCAFSGQKNERKWPKNGRKTDTFLKMWQCQKKKKKKKKWQLRKKWPKKTAIPTVFDTFSCHFRCIFDAFSAISHSFFTHFPPF
jgi:hypothetical protein